ncbi:MAG: hypothetical protein J5943_09470 [Oribacterium sp.]|nr:hypothetical protein [Oribacterium sp.]MBP3806590.1 hypothetical protein [Oribacterium sp.]
MKRRNLCSTKKLMAVILAASMMMSSGITAFAEEEIIKSGFVIEELGKEDSGIGTSTDLGVSYESDSVTVEVDGKGQKSGSNVNVEKSETVEGGVYASSEDNDDSDGKDVAAKVTVDGDVKDDDKGISAESFSKSSTDTKASTDVTVTGSVEVKNDNSGAAGIYADADSSGSDSNATTTVKVGEDVDVTGKDSSGIIIKASGSSSSKNSLSTSKVNIEVGDDVNVTSSGSSAVGMSVSVSEGAEANATIGGDLNSTGKSDNDNHYRADAYGIEATVSGDLNVTVGGDINATSENGWAQTILVDVVSGDLDINVGGSVTQDGKNGFAIALPDSTDGNITITVGKDVKATTTAVNISDGESATKGEVELTVGGEISGGEHNIVLSEKASLDDINITVWKVDTSNNKDVVETSKYNESTDKKEYTRNEAAEKTINYIIKADSNVAQIALSGEGKQVGSNYVANQDNKVYFSVDIPSGYTAEFYDVNGNTAYEIIPNGSGGAYISVPRGGGVYVGVRLTQTSTSTTTENNVNTVSRTESGASDGEYWSPGYNNSNVNAGGVYVGYDTTQLQGLQVHSMSIGGDVAQNITDVLTPVDTLTAFNNFEGTSLASIDMNNVMGSGIVNFNDLFIYSISDTVEVPVSADVYANQSYTVMFSDGSSMVVTCAMNGVLNIPFSKNAKGLTYIIYKAEVNPAMFMGMPEATGWTY